jgi:hypothetical protein
MTPKTVTLNDLQALRKRIAPLVSERDDLTDGPAPQSEVRGELRRHLAHLERQGHERLGAAVGAAVGGDMAGMFTTAPALRGIGSDMGPLLAAVLGGDALMAALEPHLAKLPDGPDTASRAARLAKVKAELFRLECEEEDVITALEANGQTVERRGDADPAAVLRVA